MIGAGLKVGGAAAEETRVIEQRGQLTAMKVSEASGDVSNDRCNALQ